MKKLSRFLPLVMLVFFNAAAFAALPVTSNLMFHYDAGSLMGYSTGDSVLQWPDLETSINNVLLYYDPADTNFAPYSAPTYVANAINGNPAVRFSSADKSLLRSAQSSWGNWTTSGGTTMFIVATGGKSTDEQRAFQIGRCGDWTVTGGEYNANKSMAVGLKSDRGFSGSYFNSGYTLAESPFVEGQWHISIHQQPYGQLASSGSYAIDGETDFTYKCAGTATVSWYAPNNTSLMGTCTGRAVGDWQPSYNGDIAEVIVYRAMLTTAQKQSVYDYLSHKYITCGAHNPAPVPAAVNVGAQAGSLVEVDFSWNTGLTSNGASVNPNIAAHYLYISTNRNFTGVTPITIPIGTAVQSYTSNLNPGTTYYWRVDESILIDGVPSAPNDSATLRGSLWQFGTRTSTSVAQPVVGAWKPIFKGAELAYASTNYPRLEKITAIRIDLQDPDLNFYLTPSNGGSPLETTTQTGSSFMSSSGCQIAINAHYYVTSGGNADLDGLGMSNGNIVSPATDEWPSGGTLLITPLNVATVEKTYATTNTAPYKTAVESRQWFILNQGAMYDFGDDTSIHPRSAVGITQDGRYMVLMTIDGRQTGYSEGAEIYEVAKWLIGFGSYMGLNLDGGGSTHMLMRNTSGTVVTLNSPSENRAVGSHLGAYMAPAPAVPNDSSDAPVTDGLIIHLRADVLQLSNDQPVKVWPDTAKPDSVNGTVYSYGGCGIPTFKTNACNGLPAVHFNAASKQALMSETWSWDQTKGVTVIMVCTGGDANTDMAAHVGDLDGTVYKTLACDVSSRASAYSYGSGVQYNNGWCRTSTAGPNPVQSGAWHTTVRKIAQNAGYGSLVYAVNSFPAVAVETDQPTKNTAFAASNNVIAVGNGRSDGDWLSGSNWYTGDVAEILVYNKQLTEAQMQQMMIHLNRKYDLYYNPGDFEPDKDVDIDDLAVLAQQWLSTGDNLSADIYPPAGDGTVDISDFAEFARYWMTTVE